MKPSRESIINVRDHGAVGDGRRDDTSAIQQALDSGAAQVLIPPGDYLISNALRPHSQQTVEIRGNLRLADAVIRPLADDIAPGDQKLRVASAGDFRVGQWVTVCDDHRPTQGGGRKTRRQSAECAPIAAIKDDWLVFERPFRHRYLAAANGLVGTQPSVILLQDVHHVRLCGDGSIDANKTGQFNVAPGILGDTWEETRAGCAIAGWADPDGLDQITIEGLTLTNAVLHNLCLHGAVNCTIRDCTISHARDKNLILKLSHDCLIQGNSCCHSEFEDGIIFHQHTGNWNHRVIGNLCTDNARNGLHVGEGEHHLTLADNVCLRNGLNLSLHGEHCTSTGDTAIDGCNRLFPYDRRPNVLVVGEHNRVSYLTALGTPAHGVVLAGLDNHLAGGFVGNLRAVDGIEPGAGILIGASRRVCLGGNDPPRGVSVSGIHVLGCPSGIRICPEADAVDLCDNFLGGTNQPLEPEAEADPDT